MKTGDGAMDTSALEQGALDLFLPVMESATVLGAHYAMACGRDVMLAEDMHYGLMFAARNVLGKQVGSLYPEAYEADSDGDPEEDEQSRSDCDPEEDESDASSWETVDDEDLVWTRYEGTDELALSMNQCADTWDSWEPSNPAERALKNAVDKNSFFGRK